MSAPDLSLGLIEEAEHVNFQVGVWHDLGYAVPPTPDAKPVPPLGERSATAITAGHAAVGSVDALIRHLHQLRDQLVTELREDADIRAVRAAAMLARPLRRAADTEDEGTEAE